MPETSPLRPNDPEQIGAYRLTGRLGEGGQGVVYLGTAPDRREVAVKLLHAQFSGDAKARARFAGELASAKRVAPFCTAQILDADVEGDTPYLVSEFIDGPSLREVVDGRGPTSGGELQRLAIGTATALAAIHEAGVVHRDFKPTNVLLATDGPRVIDFGIARALDASGTLSSTAVGTPSYMAPEQIAGEVAGPSADVFAWACTIAYAATGAPPFGQDSIPAVMNRILHRQPALGMLMGPLREIVTACLTKDPVRRPTMQQILLRLLSYEGVVLGGSGGGLPATALTEGAQAAAEAGSGGAGTSESVPPPTWAPRSSQGPAGNTPPPGVFYPGHPAGNTPPPGGYRPGHPGGNTPPGGHPPGRALGPGDTQPPGLPPTAQGYEPGPYGPGPKVRPGVLAGAAAAVLLLITVGAVVIVKYAGGTATPTPTPTGRDGGTFRMAMYSGEAIDPSNALLTSDFFAVENLFTGLTSVRTDGTVGLALATKVDTSDCTRWAFTIKHGTTFSDGEPVDATAFARSWNRTARNKAGGEGYMMDDFQGYDAVRAGTATTMTGVTAGGPDELRVTLTKPDCDFVKRIATPVFVPMPASAGEPSNQAYNRRPIGNGPFKVGAYTPDSHLTLVRNDSYALTKPRLDRVEVTFVSDLQPALSGFDSGQYDWSEVESTTLANARARHSADGMLTKGAIDGMTYLLPIGDKGQLRSKEARLAVSYALDRQAIVSAVYAGMYAPASSIVPPSIPGANLKACAACVRDTAKAKQLAAQAGLGPGTTVTLSLGDSTNYTQLASAVQQQLTSVLGWKITLRKLPLADIYQDEASKNAKDLYPFSWVADYPAPESFLYSLLATDSIQRSSDGSIGGSNRARYSNPAFDAALNTARSTADSSLRTERFQAAEKIALDDMALIPLYSHTVYRLTNTRSFTNVRLDYIGYPDLVATARK